MGSNPTGPSRYDLYLSTGHPRIFTTLRYDLYLLDRSLAEEPRKFSVRESWNLTEPSMMRFARFWDKWDTIKKGCAVSFLVKWGQTPTPLIINQNAGSLLERIAMLIGSDWARCQP